MCVFAVSGLMDSCAAACGSAGPAQPPSDQGLQRAGLLIVGPIDIDIPANTTGVEVTEDCVVPKPMDNIFTLWPHMHQLGRRFTSSLTRGDTSSMLLDIGWNCDDQPRYALDQTAAVGDRLTLTCTYDNPTPNDVHFGMSTKDEMCTGFFYYYPATQTETFCD